jgi:hypothetical protein
MPEETKIQLTNDLSPRESKAVRERLVALAQKAEALSDARLTAPPASQEDD